MRLKYFGINAFANISPLKGLTFYIHIRTHIKKTVGHITPIYWTMKMCVLKIKISYQK
jgi:hypothetical protein